jgi:hypothetical protein
MPPSHRAPAVATAASRPSIPVNYKERIPLTAPAHGWLTSPARSHAGAGQGTELPLHLIAIIINYVRGLPRGCCCASQADDLM